MKNKEKRGDIVKEKENGKAIEKSQIIDSKVAGECNITIYNITEYNMISSNVILC